MIRRARNTKKEIIGIHDLILFGVGSGKVLPRSIEEIQKVIDSFYVCEIDGKIVGCCAIEVYSKKMAEVRSLVVDAAYQGKHIGRKLVEQCVEEARQKEIYEVLAITDRDAFFEKLGFSKELNGQWPMFLRFGKSK